MNELLDFIERFPASVPEHLADLLNAVLPLLLNEEPRIYTRVRIIAETIRDVLGDAAGNSMEPFSIVVMNYVICSLTHANAAVALNGLNLVDILPSLLNLQCLGEDVEKLLRTLIAMIGTVNDSGRKSASIRLVSVGQFAKSQPRLMVMLRILKIVEAGLVFPRRVMMKKRASFGMSLSRLDFHCKIRWL